MKLGFLNDRKIVEKVIDEKFGFIDFEQMKMKNCGEATANNLRVISAP